MLFMELVSQITHVIVSVNVAVKIVTGVETPLHCMLVGFMMLQILLG
jgi:hypothetical protein